MGIDSWTERIEIFMSSLTHILYIHTTKHVCINTQNTQTTIQSYLFFLRNENLFSRDTLNWSKVMTISNECCPFQLSTYPRILKKIYYVFQHKY